MTRTARAASGQEAEGSRKTVPETTLPILPPDRDLAQLARALAHPARVAIVRYLLQCGERVCTDLSGMIDRLRADGRSVAAYGAAALTIHAAPVASHVANQTLALTTTSAPRDRQHRLRGGRLRGRRPGLGAGGGGVRRVGGGMAWSGLPGCGWRSGG